MSKTKDLTQGHPSKILLMFSLPIFMGNILQQLYSTVDSVIVGQFVGAYSLGAIGTTFPITFMVVSIATGLSNGAAIMIGQSFGSGQVKNLKKMISVCVISTIVLSAVLTVICFFTAPYMLDVIKVSRRIYDEALIYLQVYFTGLVFTFTYNMISSVFRALGDSKTPLIFLAVSSVLNVILDLYFVLSLSMGVFGVAVATVISQGISFVLQIVLLLKRMKHLSANDSGVQEKDFAKKVLLSLARLAVPSTLQEMTIGINIFITQAFINTFGPNASTAYTACGKIENFAMMPMISMMIAATVFIAQNTGAKQYERAYTGFKWALAINSIIAFIIAVIIFAAPRQLMYIFLAKDTAREVFTIGSDYLVAMMIYVFFMGVLFAGDALLKGSGDVKVMVWFAAASTITKIAASYIGIQFWDVNGIFFGAVCSWLVEMRCVMARVLSGKWRKRAREN